MIPTDALVSYHLDKAIEALGHASACAASGSKWQAATDAAILCAEAAKEKVEADIAENGLLGEKRG